MKQYLLFAGFVFAVSFSLAQDVILTDSVIYIDKKPAAFFFKELNTSIQRYNMEVYALNGDPLIKAEAINFEAPVRELKSFYYYEITFPPLSDTFAVYYEGEAFPLALGQMIKDYKLIEENKLNSDGVKNFKTSYLGGPVLMAKIKSVENYLVETRNFDEQVVRDRTKPVTIIRERVIMQDGVKVGTISKVQVSRLSNQPAVIGQASVGSFGLPAKTYNYVADTKISTVTETELHLANGRKVDLTRSGRGRYYSTLNKNETGKKLYDVSRPKKQIKGSTDDNLLRWVCFLIEDYNL